MEVASFLFFLFPVNELIKQFDLSLSTKSQVTEKWPNGSFNSCMGQFRLLARAAPCANHFLYCVKGKNKRKREREIKNSTTSHLPRALGDADAASAHLVLLGGCKRCSLFKYHLPPDHQADSSDSVTKFTFE